MTRWAFSSTEAGVYRLSAVSDSDWIGTDGISAHCLRTIGSESIGVKFNAGYRGRLWFFSTDRPDEWEWRLDYCRPGSEMATIRRLPEGDLILALREDRRALRLERLGLDVGMITGN